MDYRWPGNIRELKATVQTAVNLAQGKRLEIQHLPEHMRSSPKRPKKATVALPASQPIVPLEEVEKAHILNVFKQLNRNKSQTAKALGIGLNTLRRKLAIYQRS